MKNLKPYKKTLAYSFAFGVFPTIELLASRADIVSRVLLRSSATENKGISKIKELCNQLRIKFETNDKAINKTCKKENIYAVGIFQKFKSKIQKNENTVVLVNPETAGNLGTIIRTMLGFRVKNLAIIQPAVDIFQPEVIRSSMGAAFKINFKYFSSFEDYKDMTSNNIYCFTTDAKESLQNTKFQKPFTIVFGNEGAGLSKKYSKYGTSVKIPQSKEIDSLNLAVSAGIGIYQATMR